MTETSNLAPLWSQTATVTVANTTTETTLISSTGVGSSTMVAGRLRVGSIVHLVVSGELEWGSGGSLDLRLYLGGLGGTRIGATPVDDKNHHAHVLNRALRRGHDRHTAHQQAAENRSDRGSEESHMYTSPLPHEISISHMIFKYVIKQFV